MSRIWDDDPALAVEAEAERAKHRARQYLDIGSDVEIAGRVADDLQADFGEVRYCEGRFWHYCGTHWTAHDEQHLRLLVHGYDGAIHATPSGKPGQVRLGRSRIDSIINELGAVLAAPDFFSRMALGINCRSGFISIAPTGRAQLDPHHPDYRCRHVLPGRWSDATNGRDPIDPPPDSLLGRLLYGIFAGDDDASEKRQLLAEIAGAAALGWGTRLRQPKAVILYGNRAQNGKSQILDLLRGLLPPDAIASITAGKMGDERFIVHLVGKLLNASDELSSSKSIASDTFKAVITGDFVSGRDVYRSLVSFRPIAQHMFATNALPVFSGGIDRGVQRRLLPVIFGRVIPAGEQVESIGQRVGEEEPDLLLAFAVAGACRLIQKRRFTIPPSSKSALQDWLNTADPVRAWVWARVTVIEHHPEQHWVTSRRAYEQFTLWARAEGFRAEMLPAVNGFVQQVLTHAPGIRTQHKRAGNRLTGIAIGDKRDDDE
jgi:P4 family phage/plasmid primase-like protien